LKFFACFCQWITSFLLMEPVRKLPFGGCSGFQLLGALNADAHAACRACHQRSSFSSEVPMIAWTTRILQELTERNGRLTAREAAQLVRRSMSGFRHGFTNLVGINFRTARTR